jgi:peptidoglycan/LPS O-acetylase OafA/YrhL
MTLLKQPARAPRLYTLQVYRAVAAILVVLFHVTFFVEDRFGETFLGNAFAFGYTGVDFFFVLSGFIILYTHLGKQGRQQHVGSYLYRRLFRIYPLYWSIATVKVGWILLVPTVAKEYEREWGYLFKSYLLIPQDVLPIIGAAWTLSHELLFYLLFALTLVCSVRATLALAGGWVLLTALLYGGHKLGLAWVPNHYLVWFLFNERNLEFLLGCLGAYIVYTRWGRAMNYGGVIALLGLLLLIGSSTYLTWNGGVPSYLFFFGLPSFLLILGSAILELGKAARWPSWLVLLGDASYSIYLAHGMAINLFIVVGVWIGFFQLTGMMLGAVIMSIFAVFGGLCVYFVIERPLLNRMRQQADAKERSNAAPYAVANSLF